MDYMSGGNVRQHYLQGQRVPFPTIIRFVKRIAEALQYAHNHKPAIIHQDIKPENLLLNAKGNIFLSDFGFEQSILQTGSNANRSAGPNYYIAPEQLDMSRIISPATDQYALAAIVYEWLCGQPPFEGKPTEIVRKIRTATPPALREQVPQLPQQVEHVVIQALAKQPLQRFASVQAFAQAFATAFGI
jgi:serine/threonine protein kinase